MQGLGRRLLLGVEHTLQHKLPVLATHTIMCFNRFAYRYKR